MSPEVERATELVAGAKAIVVLSGAGLSTASGIPDFRGAAGLWTQDPEAEKISTLSWYLNDDDVRAKAWRYRATSPIWDAQPNAAHRAIMRVERDGRVEAIVTQNTDGLHQLAGSARVLEVHGNVRTWRCEQCRAEGPMAEMVERARAGERDPRCPQCGGIVRATTILFEEMLDPTVIDKATDAVISCDLLMAVGTSLTVYPVAGLVPLADRLGVPIIIVNHDPTPFDDLADVVLRDAIVDVLPTILGYPASA